MDTTIVFRAPSRDRTETLLLYEPNSKWFDNPKTDGIETAEDVLEPGIFYLAAVNELIRDHGNIGKAGNGAI
jgi:penicillin amidase